MAAVETRNLTKIYKMGESEVHALRKVNLRVKRGEFVSLMGPSGSGKSTLLHLIGALDRPTSGKVLIDGEDISKKSEGELTKLRLKKIGFIFQRFYLIPTLNSLENVILPMREVGLSRSERARRAEELLKLVGLSGRSRHRPSQLSGGEQQRVAIARALANDPSLVLADEPTGELDTKTGGEIVKLMHRLNHDVGQTFIIVTHDPAIAKLADKTIEIRDGIIVK